MRRDLESAAQQLDQLSGPGTLVTADDRVLRLLAKRFKLTLKPGLIALESLRKLVDSPDAAEDSAIAAHDAVGFEGHPIEKSLRKRVTQAIG